MITRIISQIVCSEVSSTVLRVIGPPPGRIGRNCLLDMKQLLGVGIWFRWSLAKSITRRGPYLQHDEGEVTHSALVVGIVTLLLYGS